MPSRKKVFAILILRNQSCGFSSLYIEHESRYFKEKIPKQKKKDT